MVIFRVRGNLHVEFPELGRIVGPVFFALSGFVLTLDHVEKMGDRLNRHGLRLTWATVPTTPVWTSRGRHTNPPDPYPLRELSRLEDPVP